jgi:EAL domain-containing protein (putative c-di-GMP-specific phosphodiesterase class I)
MRQVLATIDASGLEPEHLMIELTESALMDDTPAAMDAVLAQFHRRAIKLAIDDFGTGHSSLGRLHQMRVSALKIDRSFVRNLKHDPSAQTIVTSIIQLAHNLALEPIAEGIETPSQRRFLREHGCDLGQGFHFSRPVPAEQIPALVCAQGHTQPTHPHRAVA